MLFHKSTNSSLQPQSGRISIALLVAVMLLALWYQIKLLQYGEWGDESETIIAARMLAAGMRLYSEIFNHHGPLVFLPGYLLEMFGHFSVSAHRVPIAVLQWLAILAIYRSPLLRNNPDKHIFLAITITAMIGLLPGHFLFGHTYIYQVIAGLSIVIILAQYTLPTSTSIEQPSHAGIALGSVLIASLPFLAITYLPAAGLLFLSSLRRAHLRLAFAYSLVAVVFNLAFLGIIGSFKGYVAYHIYLNAKILPLYNDGQGIGKLIKNMLAFISATAPIESFLCFTGLFMAFSFFGGLEKARLPWRSALAIGAIVTLLMRGFAFQGSSFWYAYIGLMSLCLAQLNLNFKQKLIWQILVCFCILRLAFPLIIDKNFFRETRNETTLFGELAKAITDPTDRVIAYSFRNFEYLAADRLPASGHFFYLPWQEKYNEAPRFGIHTNACEDIKQYRPKLMLIDKWLVWDKFTWDSYAGCIQDFLNVNYQKIPNEPIYVRSDYYDKANVYLATIKKSQSR